MVSLPTASMLIAIFRAMTDKDMFRNREDSFIAIGLFIFFAISLLFTICQWRLAGILLSKYTPDFGGSRRLSVWGWVLGTILLISWMLFAVSTVSSVLQLGIDTANRIGKSFLVIAVLCVVTAIIMLMSYLLAIQAHFEVGRRRRRSEEEMLLSIGQRPIGHP